MAFGVNKNLPLRRKNSSLLSYIYYIFVFYMFVLDPTSINGVLADVNSQIISWTIVAITVVIAVLKFSHVNWKHLLVIVYTMVYMLCISIISNYYNPEGRFSIARVAPILCFLILSLVSVKTIISIKLVKLIVHLFMIIFTIWNLLIVVDNIAVKDFTISHYSQLYDAATSNMFLKHRPIMSFGIYTFASYFYFIFFLLIRSLLQLTNNKIYLLYLILLLSANILLVSNTAFVFSFIMAFFIFTSVKSKSLKVFLVFIILLVTVFAFTNVDLTSLYLESFSSDANGYNGRYAEGGTLFVNLNFLKDNFFIGFNIIDNLTYSDSGYIVYYTMGSAIFVIIMYYCLYKFSVNNLSKNYLYFLLPTMFFEFALPVIIYYKFIYAAIFLIFSYKTIEFHTNRLKE